MFYECSMLHNCKISIARIETNFFVICCTVTHFSVSVPSLLVVRFVMLECWTFGGSSLKLLNVTMSCRTSL